jgi:hypothetical protein
MYIVPYLTYEDGKAMIVRKQFAGRAGAEFASRVLSNFYQVLPIEGAAA